MQQSTLISALFVAGIASTALAHDGASPVDGAVGKVERVYVREATGLLIEKKLLRRAEHREIWADVRGPGQAGAAQIGELFKIPEGVDVARGDLVAVRMGDTWGTGFKLLPMPNQITQLVAPRDSLMALMFGVPNAPTAVWLNPRVQAGHAIH